ncbi:MAG TPA: flagellar export protein FliJ [Terriglobia bacterium]|nr:flagellar export protein FliJ [Terriglobia bacterium]
MAFRFPLEAILKLRRAHERRELLRLVALSNELNYLQQQEQELIRYKRETREATESALLKGMSAGEFHFMNAVASAIDKRQQAVRERKEMVTNQHLTQQALYQQTRRNRKILDNLRARQLAAYHQKQTRREQQQVDELFVLRFPKTRP